jgi:hypothetical protein
MLRLRVTILLGTGSGAHARSAGRDFVRLSGVEGGPLAERAILIRDAASGHNWPLHSLSAKPFS